MESSRLEMCNSLVKWFQVFDVSAPHSNLKELSDGMAMAQALNQIAPDFFTDEWLMKIKPEVGTNWRLKNSNLKKVVEKTLDYYGTPTVAISLSFTDFTRPDTMKIAESSDAFQIGRMLQLILGCAINCSSKENYIKQIMSFEESLQQNIMQALQELENTGTIPSRQSLSLATFNVNTIHDDREKLAQRCHESERQISLLLEEKTIMQLELNRLQDVIQNYENPSTIDDQGTSIGPIQPGTLRYTELRRQYDMMKEELLLVETTRDDLKIKLTQQDELLVNLQSKVNDLNHTSLEVANLKDELDALREANEKLKIYETQLANYKKKMGDYNDLKKQVALLEERSAAYLEQNMQQQEDVKKYSTLKGQVDLYKKEVQDLHTKLDSELSKNDKMEFELNNLSAKLIALQREKNDLLSERDALRETCDELRCNPQDARDPKNAMSSELLSPGLKERLEQLEMENKILREGQGGQTALAQLLDDSNQRTEKLREQLRAATQKILSLTQNKGDESKGNELLVQLKQSLESNEQKANQIENTQTQISQLQAKIVQLETTIATKDQEISAADVRYKKCVEKAKEVIKNVDARAIGDLNLSERVGDTDIDSQPGPNRPMGPVEEKLLVTALYELSFKCQRDAVDARLASLNGAGQSFLSRQRQPAARKPHTIGYKSGK